MRVSRNTILIIAIAAIAVILAISYIYLSALLSHIPVQVQQQPGVLSLNVSISSQNIFSYDYASRLMPFVLAKYSEKNATSSLFELNVYSRNPVMRIYLLNVTDYCYRCYNEQGLYQNLSSYLQAYGLEPNSTSFSYIGFSQLQYVPKGSIIIIPSGLLPILLLPYSPIRSNYSILNMLNDNDTVFYLGTNFTQAIGLLGGVVYTSSAPSINAFNQSGIGTEPASFNGTYLGPKNIYFYFTNQTFSFTNGYSYGPLAYVYSGNGTIVSFSNNEQSGWKNNSEIASDISKAIYGRVWIPSYSYGSSSLPPFSTENSTGSIGIFADSSNLTNSNATITALTSSHPMLTALFSNSKWFGAYDIPFHFSYSPNGTISMPPSLGLGTPTDIGISVNTNTKRQIISYLSFYYPNMTNVRNVSLGFFNVSPIQNSVVKQISLALANGRYIAIMKNFYNNTYYSGAVFDTVGAEITPILLDFSNETFEFQVTSNGNPVSGVGYSIDINGSYPVHGYLNHEGIIYYKLPNGSFLPPGNVSFGISMLGTTYNYFASRQTIPITVPPIFIEFGIVAVIIVLVNVFIRAPKDENYYIDVQEFRPVERTKISIEKSAIMDIFDKVNTSYHWRFMPLTKSELRGGISNNIKYSNMAIAVTFQNTDRLLNTLIQSGDVMESDGYFAPNAWIGQSGHDMKYLATFRKARDYCITHTMLFTDLDAAGEEADMIITKGSSKAYIMIYSEKNTKSIRISKDLRYYLLFFSEDDRRDFMSSFYSATGELAEIFDMAISYRNIVLADAENLDQIVF